MKYSKLNVLWHRMNNFLEILKYGNKDYIPSLWKCTIDNFEIDMGELYKMAYQLTDDKYVLNDMNSTKDLTIKSQKGMLKKQGQEIVEQRKEIAKLKKELEDSSTVKNELKQRLNVLYGENCLNKSKPTKSYNVYITFYNHLSGANDCVVKFVETSNIYEYIGKYVFYDVRDIKSISYLQTSLSYDEWFKSFLDCGYKEINEHTFIKRGI